MKKKMVHVLSTVVLLSSLAVGCGSPGEGEKKAASGSSAAQLESQLVVAGNGATVEKLMKDKIFKKFNEKHPDVKLTYISGVSTEIVAKVKAQQAAPQIDVTVIEGGEQEKGREEGLWEKITDKEVPSLSKIPADLKVKDESGVAVNFTPMGISYNADLVKEKGLPVPTSWNDLARPEMKGNLTLTGVDSNFGRSALIMLAYANGGSEKDMEPGFKKMEAIAGYMPTFAKSAAQLQQNLQSKSAVYTAWTMARSLKQKDSGVNLEFVFPKEGAPIVPNVATLVKDAKHPNAAKEFVNFLLSDEVQVLYGQDLYYNPAVPVKLPDDIAKKLEFDRSKVVDLDYTVVSSKTPDWMDRYNKEIAPKMGK